jgi:hypothetical protein
MWRRVSSSACPSKHCLRLVLGSNRVGFFVCLFWVYSSSSLALQAERTKNSEACKLHAHMT